MSMTVKDAMALAVLKGDDVAAYALADKVIEEFNSLKGDKLEAAFKAHRLNSTPVQGFDMWKWPEFKAFLKRLGVPWNLPVTDMTIKIPSDGLVTVDQTVQCREERS